VIRVYDAAGNVIARHERNDSRATRSSSTKRGKLFIRLHNETLAAIRCDYGQHCSLNRWIQTALSNSKNAVSYSSAGITKRFPRSSNKE